MKNRKLWFIVPMIVFLTASILLISGSSVLTLSLSQKANIPLGTFITWFGIIALPLTLFCGAHKLREPSDSMDIFLAYVLKGFIVLALLWVPICYLLAGNISFTFTEKAEFQGGQLAMRLFWYFSYFVASGPIILFLIYGIASAFNRKKQ